MQVEQMLEHAVTAGVVRSLREIRSKLQDACLVEPCYETPFGTTPGVEEKIDELMQLLLPSVKNVEATKVYRRMASVLRGDNDKDF